MDVESFKNSPTGHLVPIEGWVDGEAWRHVAFVTDPLGDDSPGLSGATYRSVADARAALASLDATAQRLPNPRLFRAPTLRIEAQSTAALEGTYEPVERVLTTSSPDLQDASMREVLNYLDVAERAFALLEGGRSLTASHLEDLQGVLMLGTRHAADDSGRIRTVQVVVGRRASADPQALPVAAARFVPPPPGADLRIRVDELLTWMQAAHADIDPVVAAAMSHYTFEALHPFHDGNGRLGRLLIVLSLAWTGTLREPTLSVSPWFEARRQEYYDRLLAVSTEGDWSGWVRFFADGLAATAAQTESRMMALVVVRDHLRDLIRDSPLRSARAYDVVDVALAATTVSVADVSRELGITRSAAKKLIDNLVGIDVLAPVHGRNYNRHYYAPMVLDVLRRG